MAIIEDSILAGEISALDPGESWDGYTIVPMETEHNKGVKVVATTNRDILCQIAGMMIPFDSLTINTTENVQPVHGAGYPRGYALVGGDIDSNYSVEFGTWLEKSQVDVLRNALFAGPMGQAVYHTLVVTFLGDPAKGGAGRHVLLTLSKCKAKSDSWTFGAGGVNKGKFDGLALDYVWAGK